MKSSSLGSSRVDIMDLDGVMAPCLLVIMDLRDLDGSRRIWRSPLCYGVYRREKYSCSSFLCNPPFLDPFFTVGLNCDLSANNRLTSSLNRASISLTLASIYSIHTFNRSCTFLNCFVIVVSDYEALRFEGLLARRRASSSCRQRPVLKSSSSLSC